MKKCSSILALVAVSLLFPITVYAQSESGHHHRSSRSHRSRPAAEATTKQAAEPVVETQTEEVVASDDSEVEEAVNEEPALPPECAERECGTFSDEQMLLNNRAVDAVNNGNFKMAEQLYFALLQLGEFNVIWYQLATTYAKENKCLEAYDAFKRVKDAPILVNEDITPDIIAEYTEQGIKGLDEQCSSRVRMLCATPNMKVSIDGGLEFDCNENEIKVVPGKHAIYARTDFGFNSATVVTQAGQLTESKVEVIDYDEVAKNIGMTVEDLEKKSKIFKITGYSLLGAGVATAAVSGGLMGYYYFDYVDKFNHQQNKPDEIQKLTKLREERADSLVYTYAFLAVGGAMAVTGAVLLIIDAVKIQPQLEYLKGSASVFEVTPFVSPEFTGLSLSGRF